MSGNGMSYGEGPIQQLYDSCGPDGSEPHAICGFIFGAGAELPSDSSLRPQVGTFFWSRKCLVPYVGKCARVSVTITPRSTVVKGEW